MMAITHAIISSAGTSLILGKTDALTIGLAVLGSQLPDLDTSSSFIGQICFPISRWLENNFPHRTITHSLLATLSLMAIAFAIGFYQGDSWRYLALPLGHLLSCFSDCFTKQGVQLFYPMPVWAISVANPYRRLRTGSTAEYYVLVVASVILFLNIKLIANNGSLNNAISRQLGLRPEIVKLYNQSAKTHMFTASVKGYLSGDRQPIDQEFMIVANVGNEFILSKSNAEGTEVLYKTGTNIIVDKLEINKGKHQTTVVESILLDDQPVSSMLTKYNNSTDYVYVNGILAIDYPQEVTLPDFTNQHQYFILNNYNVTLDHCPVKQAIALLKDQYGLGQISLIIKKTR